MNAMAEVMRYRRLKAQAERDASMVARTGVQERRCGVSDIDCSKTECNECPKRIELMEAEQIDNDGGRIWLPVECGMAESQEKGGSG
jgi:hypothetical protein